MTDDIVARLRDYNATVLAAPPYYRELNKAAADEIERLREQLTRLKFMRIREVGTLQDRLHELSGDAGQLREERDDARREICEWVAMMTKRKPSTAAKDRGWDCFKENNDEH